MLKQSKSRLDICFVKRNNNNKIVINFCSKVTVDQLEQFYMLTPGKVKDAYLFRLLKEYTESKPKSSVIVFTNTCRNCQVLALMCRKFNIPSVEIHSLMKQRLRMASLAQFKSSQVKVLFATDVASRYKQNC